MAGVVTPFEDRAVIWMQRNAWRHGKGATLLNTSSLRDAAAQHFGAAEGTPTADQLTDLAFQVAEWWDGAPAEEGAIV